MSKIIELAGEREKLIAEQTTLETRAVEIGKRIAEINKDLAKELGISGVVSEPEKAPRVEYKPLLIPALIKAGNKGVNLKEFAASTGLKFGSMTTWASALKNMGILERTSVPNSSRVIAGKTQQDLEKAKPPAKKVEKVAAKKSE